MVDGRTAGGGTRARLSLRFQLFPVIVMDSPHESSGFP